MQPRASCRLLLLDVFCGWMYATVPCYCPLHLLERCLCEFADHTALRTPCQGFVLLQAQKAAPVVPKPEQRAADVTAPQFDPMHRTSSFPTAPVTGISRSLIDELPTMALPMPEMLSESFDQDFPDYLN